MNQKQLFEISDNSSYMTSSYAEFTVIQLLATEPYTSKNLTRTLPKMMKNYARFILHK